VNLGNGREVPIKTLAETISNLVGFEGGIVWDSSKPDGQPRRALNVTRAKKYFGWEAEVPFEVGLKRTIEWWEAQQS
jgi:nucleoside-diphosphate-sugar epimerase